MKKVCNIQNTIFDCDAGGIVCPVSGTSARKFGFYLCTSGSARILLANHVYDIARNYLCIYTPNTFIRLLEKSEDLECILQEGELDTFFQALSSIDVHNRLTIRANPVVELTDDEVACIASLNSLLEQSKSDAEKADSLISDIHANYCLHLRNALCLKICEAYFSHRTATTPQQDRNDSILNAFLISVFNHCHKERTVQYYADEQNLSPYYFSNIIKAKSGKSAMQWIESITMSFARQYLSDMTMSVKEIADRLHFPDQSAFGRYFKHREGCSPTDYRNAINSHK